MAEGKKRRADRAGRPRMRSPGRPPVARREERQRFWAAIAGGLASEDAAVAAGVSPAVGTRWFRNSGGMPSVTMAPPSGRYLSFAEREELAILHASVHGVRALARRLGRSPSTISRELRRNAATRGGTWSTEPLPGSGMLTDGRDDPRRRSSPGMSRCGAMCRTGSRAQSRRRMRGRW